MAVYPPRHSRNASLVPVSVRSQSSNLTEKSRFSLNLKAISRQSKMSYTSLTSSSSSKSDLSLSQRSSNSSKCVMQRPVSTRTAKCPFAIQTEEVKRKELPLTPSDVIKEYRALLSPFEIKEIQTYEVIYYLNQSSTKGKSQQYETLNGDYLLRKGDQIAYRYEILSTLGRGTYGVVAKCKDHKTNEIIALKVIKNRISYHQRGLIEISILQKIRENLKKSVIGLKGSFIFRKHLCLVFELMMGSLAEMMTALQGNTEEKMKVVRRAGMEIVRGLKGLKEEKVVHMDLKPDNILLDQEGHLKLIDFGCACYERTAAPGYAQSRYYRAPEVILETGLSCSADMWSLGCILVEMAKGTVTFPGDNEKQQLALQMELLGKPPKSMRYRSAKKGLFFESNGTPKQVRTTQGRQIFPGSLSLNLYLSGYGKHFIDFISRCLDMNPESRLTPSEAEEHPWLAVGDQPSSASRHRPCLSSVI